MASNRLVFVDYLLLDLSYVICNEICRACVSLVSAQPGLPLFVTIFDRNKNSQTASILIRVFSSYPVRANLPS